MFNGLFFYYFYIVKVEKKMVMSDCKSCNLIYVCTNSINDIHQKNS